MLPRKIKSITAVHDLVAFLFPQTHNKKAVFLEKFFLRKALKRTSQVITASEHTRKDLLRIFSKFAPPKATTIYCGSGEHFKPTPKDSLKKFAQQTNLPKKFFLAVGTLEPRKNYPRLIQAFARLHKIHPEYHLIIVGKPGWNYQEIHDSVKENFLQKRVHFLGYLSNKSLNNLYNLATALAFPSLYEGFGIPPLEAMRCGCPVITSNTSSLPEVTGDAALKVDPKSSEQIFLALRTIIEDPETAEKLKSAGLNQSQKFSWDLSAQKLYNLLTQLEK